MWLISRDTEFRDIKCRDQRLGGRRVLRLEIFESRDTRELGLGPKSLLAETEVCGGVNLSVERSRIG